MSMTLTKEQIAVLSKEQIAILQGSGNSSGQKYINPRVYPIVYIDGKGGRFSISPGEIIANDNAKKMVCYKKGLIPYSGPREAGHITNVSQHVKAEMQHVKKQISRMNNEPAQGIHNPKVDGASSTEKIASNTTGEKYLDRNVNEWSKESENLDIYTRGQLAGLGQYLGLDFQQSMGKREIVQQLQAVLKK